MDIIFLDVDGVLNAFEDADYNLKTYGRSFGGFFDPKVTEPTLINVLWKQELVDNLKTILEATNAKVVISSTWRMDYNANDFYKMFELYGLTNVEIVGETPIRLSRMSRGGEIQEYLNDHPEVTNYVILDDNPAMLPHQLKRFVNTDSYLGLSKEDAIKAIEILNRDKKND